MADETAVAKTGECSVTAHPDLENFTLVASGPAGVAPLQGNLLEWLREKHRRMHVEAQELALAYQQAKTSKWNTKALERAKSLAVKREQFYEKAVLAMEAGYYLFPAGECQVVAVRTVHHKPRYKATCVGEYQNAESTAVADIEMSPAGEGRYVSSETTVRRHNVNEKQNDGRVVAKRWFSRDDFLDVEFPMVACKPAIIAATSRAMALKVFDEIGILPPARKGDPVIVGRIVDPRSPGWGQRNRLSFLIGWFVDTKDL